MEDITEYKNKIHFSTQAKMFYLIATQLHEENRELKEQVELLHQMNAAANSPARRVEEGEDLVEFLAFLQKSN